MGISLDGNPSPWYNDSMKIIASFLCGLVVATWLCPPTPSVEVDSMTRKQIAYEVIEYLEEDNYDTIAAKRGVVLSSTKRSWF